MALGSGCGSGAKWLNPGYIFKIKLLGHLEEKQVCEPGV